MSAAPGGERLQELCEAIVPGSRCAGSAAYLERRLAAMEDRERGAVRAAFELVAGGGDLAALAATPEFGLVRALAIEAYYSDFVAPDSPGPGAWEAIGFNSPLAQRLRKDFSYLDDP